MASLTLRPVYLKQKPLIIGSNDVSCLAKQKTGAFAGLSLVIPKRQNSIFSHLQKHNNHKKSLDNFLNDNCLVKFVEWFIDQSFHLGVITINR